MASRIAGITVVLDGDATKLSKALEGVNKEIKNTQSQLKDTEKLLKLDPSNTELLTQKQKYLGDALTETKTKLEALNNAKVNSLDELDDVQLDALNREIAETEAALRSLEQQGATTNTTLQKMSVVGTQMQNTGEKISSAGTALLPVTAAVVAAGTAAVNTSQEFDSAMSQVAAVSGATGDDFDALREKAIEMGAKTKFSASEAAEAMNYMAMAGWKTEDMLDGIEGIMNLAAASGEDLGTTSDIVTDALTAFGLSASDSAHFADILAAASSNSNTNVSMMGETFKYAASIAGAMGYSAEDTAWAIGLMANSGIKASMAGTSLRKAMTELQGEVTLSGDAIGDVTVQTANADGSMRDLYDILMDCRTAFAGMTESEKAANAEAVAGKTGMSGFLAIMNASDADVTKLRDSISSCSDEVNGFNGTCESMANTMLDNLGGDITILKSNLESLAIAFGDLLIPVVREIVEHIQNVVTWLNSLDEGTKQTIVTVGLIAAALGPVLIVVGKTISAIGTILVTIPKLINWFKTLPAMLAGVKTAFSGFFATLAAHPIVLIIAAIAALVAAFIYCWNNVDGFKEFWINLWEKIKTAAITAWEAIKAFLATAWESIKSIAVTVWTSIVSFLSSVWEGVKSTATTVWTAISEFFTTTWETVKSKAVEIWESISSTLKEKWTSIKESCVEIWENVKDKISEIWDNIKSGVSEKITAVRETIEEGFNKAVEFITGLAEDAFEWGANIIGNIIDGIASMIDKVKEVCGKIGNKIREFLGLKTDEDTGAEEAGVSYVEDMASGVTESSPIVQEAMNQVSEYMDVNPAEGVSDAVSAEWENVSNNTTTSWTAISTYLQTTWNAISLTAQTILTTTSTFLTTSLTTMFTTFQTVMTTLYAYLLTIWTLIYTMIVQIQNMTMTAMFAVWNAIHAGITSIIGQIRATIVSGMNSAVSYIQSLISEAYSWGVHLVENMTSGMNSRMSSLTSTVSSVANTIRRYLHFSVPDVGPLHDMQTWMPDMMKNLASGIEKNRSIVQGAIADVANDLALNPKLNIADTLGNAISAKSSMKHTGTIRVEGVNDSGTLSDVVDIIIDQLRREVRA